MFYPISTYRLQLSGGFSFQHTQEILDYLQELGVKTIYASPTLAARKGSSHGYDGINPHLLNPELGNWEKWSSLFQDLKKRQMSWLQDIVPNHMAYSLENPWIVNIIEFGAASPYAHYFDIDWNHPTFSDKWLMPIIDQSVEELYTDGLLKVIFNKDGFFIKVYDHLLPVSARSYTWILTISSRSDLSQISPIVHEYIAKLAAFLESLSHQSEEKWRLLKRDLYQQKAHSSSFEQHIKICLQHLNEKKECFLELLLHQHVKLAHWKTTEEEINYRRFFTVNDLVCLNMHKDVVFRDYHSFIHQQIEAGYWQGVRIDHIDGLYDPTAYLSQLRTLLGKECYVVVEKILEQDEKIPEKWECNGSTGYEFLVWVNNLLTLDTYEAKVDKLYEQLESGDVKNVNSPLLLSSGQDLTLDIYHHKQYILQERMAGEWDNLIRLAIELDLFSKEDSEDKGRLLLREFVKQWLLSFPLYRSYANAFPFEEEDQQLIKHILLRIIERDPELAPLANIFMQFFVDHQFKTEQEQESALQFFMRSMQFTGPLMAKGVEDTFMYTHYKFIAHNEVGDHPSFFGLSKDQFHHHIKERHATFPHSINTTSTHDTKRGEDARARLQILSEISSEWDKTLIQWMAISNEILSLNEVIISERERYFIFQVIVGSCPMNGDLTSDDYPNRLAAYFTKAFREAKIRTSWSKPNELFESTIQDLIYQLLKHRSFLSSFDSFFSLIVDYGILNSLSQVILKICCPGVPDVYQGSELWNLSLVDPDNRREVDYGNRRKMLSELIQQSQESKASFLEKLWENRAKGEIKLWFHYRLLQTRKKFSVLFECGNYIPLEVVGNQEDHVLAFARKYKDEYLITAIPLYTAQLTNNQSSLLPASIDWGDTFIRLPDFFPHHWIDEITENQFSFYDTILLNDIWKQLPFSCLTSTQVHSGRKAGTFLHISSLPSSFGIGDLGDAAYEFADFLAATGQKIWQILPLTPIKGSTAYSPYSSPSSFAANTLLISLEYLQKEGFMESFPDYVPIPIQETVPYEAIEKVKKSAFEEVYQHFLTNSTDDQRNEFIAFCTRESYWLEDYALFKAIKDHLAGSPWYEWKAEWKYRAPYALMNAREQFYHSIEKEKLLQYLFDRQWTALKSYCNERGIELMGDIPIYTSYDSADVWTHPDIFKLDERLNPTHVAGVPPDYFSETGQLWGMPVFDWGRLKDVNYHWWIRRILRNMELFDLIRLDHFRGFSAYWEVPAGEQTAINGAWKVGGGHDFFHVLKEHFPDLPFVAEDLGEIDTPVYELRDSFDLPGMCVLQFAFSQEIARSIHIPHLHRPHSIVYTGTHDNNTLNGWFEKELDIAGKQRVLDYLGINQTVLKDSRNQGEQSLDISQYMIQMAYGSVADTVIIPMQDLLGLGEKARMNTPGTVENNWIWKMKKGQLSEELKQRIIKWVKIYGRY